MSCKKLFSINNNDKKFMVFLDENDRNTFLEIDSNGKFDYPLLEDYLALYKIFNVHNPYVYYHVPSFDIKSGVKVVKNGTIVLMTLITVINSIPNADAIDVETTINESSVVLYESSSAAKIKTVAIEDVDDLDKYLGTVRVTKDLILKTIAKNEKIPEEVKKIAIEEFEQIYKVHPTANYRVFYENLKTLDVNVFSEEEYNKKYPLGSSANYDSITNSINIKEGAPKDIVAHELAHSYHSFYRKLEGVVLVKRTSHTALNEGMTDIMAEYVALTDGTNSYKISKEVLEYLMYLTDFTYEEYSRFGLNYLFKKAMNKYPDIDFKYISSTLNSMLYSELYRGVTIIGGPKDMYDELFETCLKMANRTNGYEPFNRFLYTLICNEDSSLIDSYFEKYNKRLKELSYNSKNIKAVEDRVKLYNRVNCIIYSEIKEGPIAFGYEGDNDILYRINEDGTLRELNEDGKFTYYSFRPRNFELFKMKVFTRGNDLEKAIGDELTEDARLSKHNYRSIPLYVNSKKIAEKLTGSLKVRVGFTKTKKIGFILIDETGKVIYQTDRDLSNLSNKVLFNSYLVNHAYYIEDLELTEVFNENYLKKYQSAYTGFNNFGVVEDKIVEEHFSLVTIVARAEGTSVRSNYRLSDCKVYVSGDYTFASDRNLEAENYDYVIDLEIILSHANLLKDDTSYYEIEEKELEELTKNFIASLNADKQKTI